MDDFGNDIMIPFTPKKGMWNPPEFNWTAYVYYWRPDLVRIQWD